MRYGKVSVGADRGKLRLRWRVKGHSKRYHLSTGLDDDRDSGSRNYHSALDKARLIEMDIANGTFDATLGRYSSNRRGKPLTLGAVFELFLAHKAKSVVPRTLEKYRGLSTHLSEMGLSGTSANTTPDRAIAFADRLRKKLAPTTCREHLSNLGAAWEWGKSKGYIDGRENPWKMARKSIKGGRVRKAEYFTEEEVALILSYLQGNPYMRGHVPLVAFLFSTGVRIGEAKALLWEDVSEDGRVAITKTQTRDNLVLPTKNHKLRTLRLPPAVLKLLMENKAQRNAGDKDHVFITNRGNPIDDHSWRRTWVNILGKVGIENYRRPYTSRATVTSDLLMRGHAVSVVATNLGNSPRTIFEYYTAQVGADILTAPKLPSEDPPPETTPSLG